MTDKNPEQNEAAESAPAAPQEPKAAQDKFKPIVSGAKIAAIVPSDVGEAWRLAQALVEAGMVPDSYHVKIEEEDANGRKTGRKLIDWKATQARVMIGFMKGLEIGLPPITALSTIMIINNRPALWGDGAVALVQSSGKLEWIKESMEGLWGSDDCRSTCVVKRKDQSEAYVRTFSFMDAKKAGLTGKTGPWSNYPLRMLAMRARAWALRDAFSDVMMGISIAEELQDYEIEARRDHKADTSSLDVGLGIEAPKAPAIAAPPPPEAAPEAPAEPPEPPKPPSDWQLMADDLLARLKKVKKEPDLKKFIDENEPALANFRQNADPELVKKLDEAIARKQDSLNPINAG